MKHRIPAAPIALLLIISLGFSGCSGGTGTASTPVPAPVPEPVVQEQQQTPVETPTMNEGLIAYVSGIVDVSDGTDWFPAEIGDMITIANIIKTGPDSSCEIQFGTTAVIRLQENSEIAVSRINLTPESNKVGLEMVAGSVLAKVQKLAAKDSFSVRTQNTVCGVRGTEFSVSTEKGQETVLAVKEGSVAVLPPALDVEELKEQIADKGENAEAAIDQLLADAPKVEANQEISVNDAFVEETRVIVESVTRAVAGIAGAKDSAETEQKTRALTTAAAASSQTLAAKTAPVEVISEQKAAALKQTDKMKILDIPVAATKEDKAVLPALRLYKVGIKVQPSDARISLNGEGTATGNFSALYEEGTNLSFTIEREGYAPYSLPVAVNPDAAKLYTIQLAALRTEPVPEPEKPAPLAEAPKETPEPQVVTETPEKAAAAAAVTAETLPEKAAAVTAPEPVPVAVTINTVPSDAAITINGSSAGKGRARTEVLPGTVLSVSVSRRGFTEQTFELTSGETPLNHSVTLAGKPLIFSRRAAAEAVIGIAAGNNGTIVVSSAAGKLTAVNSSGKEMWTLESANNPNENSGPVIIGGKVYFSGSKEFTIADLQSGKVLQKISLDSNRSHLFGRKVTGFKGQVLYPSNNALEFIDAESGVFTAYAALPDAGSRMTPGLYGNKVLIADQQGTLMVFNNGIVANSIPTGAVQPVALAVSVNGDRAVYSGRRGDVVCINLNSNTVQWERKLSDANVSVATDIEIGGSGAYVFGRDGTIYGMNISDGSDLFTPIRGASTPPAYLRSSALIVYGTRDSKLVFASASSGATGKSLAVDGVLTTRPVEIPGDTLITAGTKQGSVLLIEPAGIQ